MRRLFHPAPSRALARPRVLSRRALARPRAPSRAFAALLAPAAAMAPRPRGVLLHCDPGGTAAPSRWAHGSEIWIRGLRLDAVNTEVFDATSGAALPDGAAFDAVVITGSPAGVYERDALPWVAALEAWLGALLRAPGRGPRVLGGCFGAQLIASSLGGLVEPAGFFRLAADDLEPLPAFADQRFARDVLAHADAEGRVAVLAAHDGAGDLDERGYALAREAEAAVGAADGGGSGGVLRVLESHGDCVRSLPPGGVLLARSRSCAVEVFLAADGRALGIQGHPEFSREEEIDKIIWPRQVAEGARMSAAEAEAALPTLALPRHHAALLLMLRRFLLDDAGFSGAGSEGAGEGAGAVSGAGAS